MIAYNHTSLENLLTRKETEKAYRKGYISEAEKENIYQAYPVSFYTPNIFVRIGLFILTVVIGLFTLGLLGLLFMDQIEDVIGGLIVFFGLLNYAALEFMVKRNHYKSGVDDALTWISGISIVGGLNILTNLSWQTNSIIIFIVSVFLCARFINIAMAGVAGISVIAFIFLSFVRLGEMAKALAPFVVMITSAMLYLFAAMKMKDQNWKHYGNGLVILSIVALISFYAGGNYFVIREISIALFGLRLQNGENIPFAWLFWLLTFLIPVLYIVRGIQIKDVVFLRTGLALTAATILTVRYYYDLLPLETAAVIIGTILITVAYVLIKYLQEPKYGFTYKKEEDPNFDEKLQVESLIIAQTFTQQPKPDDGFQFGGGSGGGAGASGEY